MTKTVRILLVAAAVPFLGACFATFAEPIPPTLAEREDLAVRGVVVSGQSDGGAGEFIEFRDIQFISWTDDAISIMGIELGDSSNQMAERRFDLSELSGVLVRELDAGRTSAIIGGTIVGTAALLTIFITGSSDNVVPGD